MVYTYSSLFPACRAFHFSIGGKNKTTLGSAMKQSRWVSGLARIPLGQLSAAVVATLLLSQSSACGGGIPCGYEVAHVIQAPYCDPFGYPPTSGIGISPNGRYVCGYYPQCVVGDLRPFVFDTLTEQFMTFPLGPGFTWAGTNDVTDDGLVCGIGNKSNIGLRGYTYDLSTGVWTELPSQAVTSGWSTASAINSSNVVCGYRSLDDGGSPTNPNTAYTWSAEDGFDDLGTINGSTTEALDINDRGFTTGKMAVNGVYMPFIWGGGELIELGSLAGLETVPFAINNINQVVGRSRVPNPKGSGFVNHAFLADAKGIIDLGVLIGFERSVGDDINDDSVVVGFLRPSPLADPPVWDHGFVWADGVMRDINDLVGNSPAHTIVSCNSIDALGTIVGSGDTNPGSVALVLKPLGVEGDVNATCTVDVDDLLMVINEWGNTDSMADVNHDQVVNSLDLQIVIKNWTFD